MPMFAINKSRLKPILEKPIKLEKNLQTLTENNLSEIFSLEFVSSEFALNNFRIDTVAFDNETNSFVLIEYKRGKSFSIVDQGYSYLALMLNHKSDFILEYNENKKKTLKREDVDWSQSRVLFIANSFTNHQRNAINFKDLPIELWEANKFSNNTILYKELKATDAKESIKTISNNETIKTVSKQVKKYSMEDHFTKSKQKMLEIFEELEEEILDLDNRMEKNIKKSYISFKMEGVKWNLCTVEVFTNKLAIHLNRVEPKDLKDPENLLVKVPWKKWQLGKYCIYVIKNHEDIPYALFLLKQLYKKFYN